MSTQRKSTMVELVQELEAYRPVTPGIMLMIQEAKAGEYHDYKNKKYVCGKVEVVRKLQAEKMHSLAHRVIQGEFDEEPDAEDQKMMADMMHQAFGPVLGA